MFRNMIRRSGMLALVLALALAGTPPAAALGFGGGSLDGWHAVWNWLAGVLGWDDEAGTEGSSGGLTGIWEQDEEGGGFDPNGNPIPQGIPPGSEEGGGFDPNGLS